MFKVQLPMFLSKVHQIKKEYGKSALKDIHFHLRQKEREGGSASRTEVSTQEIGRNSYQKGYEEGSQKERKKVVEMMAILEKIVKDLQVKKEAMLNEMKGKIVEIAIATAKKIIKKEIEEDSETVVRVVKEALKQIKQAQKITIKVNPQDWMKLKEVQPELLSSSLGEASVYIEKDEAIAPGGSLLETDKGIIDARIERQIDEVNKALSGGES